MAINMARSLNSLHPEASALLLENLGMGDSLLRRQSQQNCDTGSLGFNGECREESTCGGALYPGGCPTGFECCFISPCDVSQGSGYCKNNTRDVCNGEFYPGKPPYPCDGGDEMLCCVNYENMTNGSSTTTSSSPSATGTATNDDSSQNDGLTGSQIGGIVGGIIGAVIVTALIFTFFFWWRRRKLASATDDGGGGGGGGGGSQLPAANAHPGKTDDNGYQPIQEIHGKERIQLDGNEMVELDGHGGAVHEMEGSAPPRVLAELPASEVKRP